MTSCVILKIHEDLLGGYHDETIIVFDIHFHFGFVFMRLFSP